MQITGMQINLIEQPFAVPYKLSKSYGTLTHTRAVIVQLETDTGLIGLGEANPTPPFTDETPAGVMSALSEYIWPAIHCQDPRQINMLMGRLDLILTGNLTAKGAIDMALHDLAGKSADIPCHQLMGGRLRDKIKVLWPLSSGSADDDRIVLDAKISQGFGAFMLKMGTQTIPQEIDRLNTLYTHYVDAPDIIVDANQGWSRSEALAFVDAAAHLPLTLIEQPVQAGDMAGLTRVHDAAKQPVSADEALQSMASAKALLLQDAVDVFSIKVSKNGGIAASRRIAEMADAFRVQCLMNSMLEFGITQAASLQLGAVLPNLMDTGHAYMSTLRLAGDVTDFSDLVRDGYAHVPDRPGLGITLNQHNLLEYTVRHDRLSN